MPSVRSQLVPRLLTAVFGLATVPLVAQGTWELLPTGAGRVGQHATFDAQRGVVVAFGGAVDAATNETFEWDGANWRRVAVPAEPAPQAPHGIAYDTARGVTVLVGNSGLRQPVDTWEYDGVAWTLRSPASRPPELFDVSFGYDELRGVCVLLGVAYGGSPRQVWEWDGVGWTRRAAEPPVSGRMAYDAARGRFVVVASETWEWDGTSWIATGVAAPPDTARAALGYDPIAQRVVSFGGRRPNAEWHGETWEWDGVAWTRRATGWIAPSGREGAVLVGDSARGRLVMFGGASDVQPADTWEWDGSRWNQRRQDGGPGRADPGVEFDHGRGVMVVFGGRRGALTVGNPLLDGTWEWDGATWRIVLPSVEPAPRYGHAMVYDAARARIVLFGGVADGAVPLTFGDTWEFDGSTWVERTPAHAPSARFGHGMAFDPDRGRVVLFGGNDGSRRLPDTWEWDGLDWMLADPGRALVDGVNLQHDPRAERTFAFFDEASGVAVWEWSGSSWRQNHPATFPADGAHLATYDPARGRTVLLSGGATWEWDGVLRSWESAPSVRRPGARYAGATYDSVRERVVVYGGEAPAGPLMTLPWSFGSTPQARFEEFGSGCGAAIGFAAVGGRPWLDDEVRYELGGVPSGAMPFVLVGFDRTTIDLGPLGASGCALHTTPVDAFALSTSGGSATLTVTIPPSPALVGGEFVVQGLAVGVPSANPLGVALSAAIGARIGQR